MFTLGDEVRCTPDSMDNVAGKIMMITRCDTLDELTGSTNITVTYSVKTRNGTFNLIADDIAPISKKQPKFTSPEEAEAWMESQAGNSWTSGADDFLKGLTEGL